MKYFFTFEGIDGCGKTTIINKLEELLKKKYTIKINLESDNLIIDSAKFGKLNSNKTNGFFLFWAGRYQQQLENISQDIDIVLQDRYWDSTLVYSDFPNSVIMNFNYNNKIFPKPDITFILNISPETSISRAKKQDGIYDCSLDIKNAKEKQDKFLSLSWNHFIPENNYYIIDNEKLLDKTINEIYNHINNFINKNEREKFHFLEKMYPYNKDIYNLKKK